MTEEELEKAEKDKKEAEKKKADEMVSLVKPTISASEPESAV
jgi:hypothetical protein